MQEFLSRRRGRIKTKGLDFYTKKRLLLYNFGLSKFDSLVQKYLILIFSNQKIDDLTYCDLKSEISKLDNGLLNYKQLIFLTEYTCLIGAYTLANIFREKAKISIQRIALSSNKSLRKNVYRKYIGLLLENYEFQQSYSLEKFLDKSKVEKKDTIQTLRLNDLLNTKALKINDNSKSNKYREFLAGKKICVVGPANVSNDDGSEIDKFDLVIRLNHSYNKKGTNSVIKGTRTNVSYFNGEQGEILLNKNQGELPSELHWCCFKREDHSKKFSTLNPDKNIRFITSYNPYFFHGTPNMLPNLLLDLCNLTCFPVKLFHFDLMLNPIRQNDYYPKGLNVPQQNEILNSFYFKKSTIKHDPILQFKILSKLWQNHKIIGDEKFTEIMSKGLNAYLIELEKIYFVKYLND